MECYHIVEGLYGVVYLCSFGCWLLARVIQLFGIGAHHLLHIPQLEVELERHESNFLQKKGIFFTRCHSVCGASSY